MKQAEDDALGAVYDWAPVGVNGALARSPVDRIRQGFRSRPFLQSYGREETGMQPVVTSPWRRRPLRRSRWPAYHGGGAGRWGGRQKAPLADEAEAKGDVE